MIGLEGIAKADSKIDTTENDRNRPVQDCYFSDGNSL
jgi:hypothetical protein